MNLNEENNEENDENKKSDKIEQEVELEENDKEETKENKKKENEEKDQKEETSKEKEEKSEHKVEKNEKERKNFTQENKIDNENHKNKEDNKTSNKIKTLFESIKNFEQLKNEVYEMKKHYENLNLVIVQNFEKKEQQEQNNTNNINQQISEINKKFELLLGDIRTKDFENNESEIEDFKAMNLSEIITRLRAYQHSKANTTDLISLNEEFDIRIKELTRRLDEFKISIFGPENDNDANESNNEQNKAKDNIDNRSVHNIPRFNFASKADFEQFKIKSEEEFSKLWKEINSLRLNVDDINSNIKNKTSLEEVEELKNIILEKTEELFLSQNKRYVNFVSSLKILQDNFKKLLKLLSDKEQYYENGNNPFSMNNNPLSLGGHSCASCDNFLGDLKSEPKFVNWKKFPRKEKDNGDILKRVQNGYSRLLQMINFDNNGYPSLIPYTSSINNETNISSNMEDNSLATKERKDSDQSFSNKRLFSTKVKKISRENNNSIDFQNSKKENRNKGRKLPSIKTSKSIDNLYRIKYKSNQNSNKKEINFINPAISQLIRDSEEKNN